LELSLVAALLLGGYLKREGHDKLRLLDLGPYVGLAFITMATLRGVHHLHGEPWDESMLASAFTQASLTIVWCLVGVSGMLLGARRKNRKHWKSGGLLMVVVIGKLILIDRSYMENMPGIVACIAVGLLWVAVGYVAPQPPVKPITTSPRLGSLS